MKKSLAFLSLILCLNTVSNAQGITDQSGNEADLQLNTITTAVPFLIIGPDAKSGGMGDIGVASVPDAMSMHWNPAKYAFVDDDFGIAVAYTPWLRALIPDINLSYISGYARTNERETFGFALRYFTLGEIKFTSETGESMGFFNPNELALSSAYARKLSDQFSTAISLRYIYSNLTGNAYVGTQATNAGQSIAGDISAYYENPIRLAGKDVLWAMGLNISNIGSKIAYTETVDKDFLPTNLRIGSSLTTDIDEYNRISFEFDINKLLVPTPPKIEDGEIVSGEDPDVSVISGIFQSFSDAPSGDREVRELIYSTGFEYWYDQQFAIRSGYFYEHPLKGDRQFLSLGAGLKYNVFGLDFSYLIPVRSRDESGVVNPLSNTLRFALTFDFGALKAQEATPSEE